MTYYDIIDSILRIRISMGHSLFGALSRCRHLNCKGRCPGRYTVQRAV